jgi:hypothetical protein
MKEEYNFAVKRLKEIDEYIQSMFADCTVERAFDRYQDLRKEQKSLEATVIKNYHPRTKAENERRI